MLRLKATEITLTPADVEETRQRMERRQAANHPFPAPVRTRGPPVPSAHGARLRRGPQRSRDTAVVNFGNIPILRPQEAVEDSGDNTDDGQAPNTGSSSEDSASTAEDISTPSLPADQIPSFGTLNLPFRPAPRAAASEDTTLRTQLSPFRFIRERTNSEDDHDATSQVRIHASTDGLVEPADAVETPIRNRAHSLRQHSSHVPSPLHQMHAIGSPCQPHGLTSTSDSHNHVHMSSRRSPRRVPDTSSQSDDGEESPTIHLRGYFDRRQRYTFLESLPQSEPRPRTQPVHRARSVSSSSDPSHLIQVQRPDSLISSTHDVFWSPQAPKALSEVTSEAYDITASSDSRYRSPLGSDSAGSLTVRRDTRQRISSEASASSLAYSFYELPESHRSSSTWSQTDLAQSQYDGAAASRQVSQGAYHSIRLPHVQHRASSGAYLYSSPQSGVGQHGVSPLPTDPYTREPSGQYALRPSIPIALIGPENLLGDGQDAREAVARNLSSPLEQVEERATSHFHRLSAQMHTMHAQTHGYAGRQQDSFQHQVTGVDAQSYRHRHVYGPGPESQRHSNHNRSGAGSRPQARHTIQHQQHHLSYHHSHQITNQPVLVRGPHRSGASTARAGQRSSENVPVQTIPSTTNSRQETRPRVYLRTTQPHNQRMSLGPRPNPPEPPPSMRGGDIQTTPVAPHFSLPQLPRPRDMSNRLHMLPPHPVVLTSDDEAYIPDILTPAETFTRPLSGTIVRGPRPPPRRASRQLDSLINRPASRGPPSTTTTLDVASGITSRGPAPVHPAAGPTTGRAPMVPGGMRPAWVHVPVPVSHARPHRQTHWNEDQENSGSLEQDGEAMRQELAIVGPARHSEGVQGDQMNETPPRLGRFERRMDG